MDLLHQKASFRIHNGQLPIFSIFNKDAFSSGLDVAKIRYTNIKATHVTCPEKVG